MLDDDDVELVAIASNPTGCIGVIVTLILIAAMSYFVSQNKEYCAEKHCQHGTSQLMDHRCVCIEEPR